MNKCTYIVLSCLIMWLSTISHAMAWGAVGHAVIGQLVEDDLLTPESALRHLLARFRAPEKAGHHGSVSTATSIEARDN